MLITRSTRGGALDEAADRGEERAHALKRRGGALSARRGRSRNAGTAALQIRQHAGRVLEGIAAEGVLAD